MNLEETIELIETAPSSALHQTDKDAAHGLVIETFVTVEDEDLATEGLSEGLYRLSLSRTCRSVWITSIAKFHSHDKSQEALVREWRMHEFRCVSLVFECVVKECIAHANHALLGSSLNLVLELLEPHPVVRVARLRDVVFQ